MKTIDFLATNRDACERGVTYAKQHEMMSDVWDNCYRPDWLLWILRRTNKYPGEKDIRLFACWCARNTPLLGGRTTWDLMTDPRSRTAIEVAERFVIGEATSEELAAAHAAAAAAHADAYDAAHAAHAAAYNAAYDAAAAAHAAAAHVAAAAAHAAAAAAAYTAAAYDAAADAAAADYNAHVTDVGAYTTFMPIVRRAQAYQLREMFGNPFTESTKETP